MNEVFLIVKSLGLLYDMMALTFISINAAPTGLNSPWFFCLMWQFKGVFF